MARSRLETRIRALERKVGGTGDLTVVIRHFAGAGEQPTQYLADGDTVVEREDAEDADAFHARAVAALRRGRRGIVVLVESGEA